jgi:hypothetical protein
MDEYKVALVGNSRNAEIDSVRPAIARNLPDWDVREFCGLAALLESVAADGDFPDLIVVCQSHRDEYSSRQVREGLTAFPVARWICVTGAWCESEGRHGSRWPMSVRVPLRALETRLAIEAGVVKARIPALALTAARDEVYEFDTQRKFPKRRGKDFAVSIISPDRELRSWLSDLCEQAGYVLADAGGIEQPQLLILDLDPLMEPIDAIIQKRMQQFPQARILALMGLVPEDFARRFEESGEGRVLSKLTPAAQLLEAIDQCAQGQWHGE